MPNVGPDFKPYATNGQWVYTDAGWTWASNYPWGWATFHYGRWFYEDGYGWMWIPGQEWAPAWVSWRSSPDYYGWAPLGPSVSVAVSMGGGYNPPPHYWNFVPHQYVTSPQINNYYVNEQRNVTIINNTTVINNTTIINNNTNIRNTNYVVGPNPNEVSRYTGATVRPVVLRESSSPGERINNNGYSIYRPRVAAAPQGNSGGRPVPTRVQTLNSVRPANTAVYGGGNTSNTNTGRPVTRPANTGFPTANPVGNGAANPVNNNPINSNNNTRPGYNNNLRPGGNPAVNNPPVNNPPVNNGNNNVYSPPNTRPAMNNNGNQGNGQPVQPVTRPVVNQPTPVRPAPATNPGPYGQNNNNRPVSQPATRPVYQPGGRAAVQPAPQQGAQPAQQPGFNRNRVQPSAVPAPAPNRSTTAPAPAVRPAQRPIAPPKDPRDGDRRDPGQQ
jgi:hypothetical protein